MVGCGGSSVGSGSSVPSVGGPGASDVSPVSEWVTLRLVLVSGAALGVEIEPFEAPVLAVWMKEREH